MILTQENLYKQVANDVEDIDVTTVRKIFQSAENIIFAYLSSATPSEGKTVKILDGLSLDSKYIPEHYINRGIFKEHKCDGKIRVKGNVTKYYNDKINNR